jgi:hypothetical protein
MKETNVGTQIFVCSHCDDKDRMCVASMVIGEVPHMDSCPNYGPSQDSCWKETTGYRLLAIEPVIKEITLEQVLADLEKLHGCTVKIGK